MDLILSEGIKLKRKCRSLRYLLLDTEKKRKEEKSVYEQQIRELETELENVVAEMKGSHYIAMTQARDIRTKEIEELSKQLLAAKKDLASQNPLVVTMTNKISLLEKELESTRKSHQEQLIDINQSHQFEISSIEHQMEQRFSGEREEFELRITTLQETNSSLEQQVIQADTELCRLSAVERNFLLVQDAFEELRSNSDILEERCATLLSEVESLRKENEEVVQQKDRSAEEFRNALLEAKKAKSSAENLRLELQTVRANQIHNSILSSPLFHVQQEKIKTNSKLSRLEDENSVLHRAVEDLEASVGVLQTERDQFLQDNGVLLAEVDRLTSECERLHDEMFDLSQPSLSYSL